MRPDILILGQGLAGTMLAWEFERAGIAFAIADPGHETAASRIAAGMVNPITGRRFVKSWRIDTLLPQARATYRELESALGVLLWREMRVRRLFADEGERLAATAKYEKGEFAPYVSSGMDEAGFWIHGAGRIDLARLLEVARERWRRQGRLRPDLLTLGGGAETDNFHLVVDCTGVTGARQGAFDFVPWQFSKGQVLAIDVDGLAPEVILNRGHWVLPVEPGKAWVGATHEPVFQDLAPTSGARAQLEASAASLCERNVFVTGQTVGVRINLADNLPVAGRHPAHGRRGICNGLGAKGVIWAPMLARQWVNHLTEGVPFDEAIAVDRFRPSAIGAEENRRPVTAA